MIRGEAGSASPLRGDRRAIRAAVAVSVLVHALILAIPLRERRLASPPAGATGPLTVTLEPARVAVAPPAEPQPRKVPAKPRPRRAPLAMPPRPLPQPPTELATTVPAEPVPPPPPEPVREPPAFDMSALIAANRERRRAREAAAARGSSPSGGGPVDPGAESLARNLASLSRGDDTGGVFRILRMGPRTGEFSFHGWTPEARRTWREVIEVDAGPNGDVELAVVRRMIALIREHYKGDFNWESQRLGQVVVLSAAPADNAELEAYLLREFFGTPLVKRAP